MERQTRPTIMTAAPSPAAASGPIGHDRRPAIGLEFTTIGTDLVAVRERIVMERPFCRLLHFERDSRQPDPRVLVVAPLSGHFGVLLRDMLAALLPEHEVFLMEWIDAREIPVAAGSLGLEDNITHVIDGIRRLGGELHLIGLCQSAAPALAATALLADGLDAPRPRTLTLISGLIDPRINPTRLGRLLAGRPLDWFERFAIRRVLEPYPGRGRPVYPAAIQRAALLAYLLRHIGTGGELLGKLLDDDGADPVRHPFMKAFLAVMDLPAPFLLDTVRLVFQEFALPRGRLTWRGIRVDPSAVTRTALMTVEGGRDDVSAPGQTRIAHDLCANIPARLRRHHLQPGIGHFGTFHGKAWRIAILPRIRAFIRTTPP